MEAIRQIVKVKNHSLSIKLPNNFNAEEVEIIILHKTEDFKLSNEMKSLLDERSKENKSTFISSEESILRLKNRNRV